MTEYKQVDGFSISVSKSGKFWVWCPYLGINVAMHATSHEEALLSAMKTLLFQCKMIKTERDNLRVSMAKIESCFNEVFQEEE
jgi:hypothetical protein